MPATIEQALPLADELGVRHIVIDGECWSKTRHAMGAHTVTANPVQRPELVFVG